MKPATLVVAALGVTLGLVVIVVAAAGRRWDRTTRDLEFRLQGRPQPAGRFDAHELEGLPAPVARFFAAALTPGQATRAAARIEWSGEFRTAEADDSWRPFAATQTYSARPPGFVWDARIRMAPGLTVRVRDSYVDGAGSMRGAILGLVRIVDVHDTPEIAAAALQRYLAEAVWLPTRLLPSQGVVWTPVDDSTAVATLEDGSTRVALEFRFDAAGDVVSVFTPARLRAVRGGFEPTPWRGRFFEHAARDGMRIPLAGEVEWQLPDRPLPYWRGRVVDLSWPSRL